MISSLQFTQGFMHKKDYVDFRTKCLPKQEKQCTFPEAPNPSKYFN